MSVWSSEIKELNQIYQSVKGTISQLEKELGKLVTTDDENMLLVYSRRCLEVIVTELCEHELKRHRGTEPLQRIIDKLNKEEIVPHNIIVSMLGVNSMSTFGAHPKEFELRQIKPVLVNLTTIIEWYIKYRDETIDDLVSKQNTKQDFSIQKKTKSKKREILYAGIILLVVIVVSIIIIFDVLNFNRQEQSKLIKSLVILPFKNFTGDEKMDNYVAGLHTMLIDDMQRLRSLRIPGSTSSNAFKNKDLTIPEITSELNVDGAVETSVIGLGDTISLRFSLVRSYPEEKEIWAREFKEEKGKILNLFNQLTKNIADEINLTLAQQEKIFLAESRIVDPEAIDAYLKGQWLWERLGGNDMDSARYYFELAIQKDPGWSAPYAGLAPVWGMMGTLGIFPKSETQPKQIWYINKALELDPNSAKANYVKALHSVWPEWDWKQGESDFLRTLELNPNDALARLYYAHLLMILHREEEAVQQAEIGLELDPQRPLVLGLYAVVMQNEGNYKSALNAFEKALSIDPNNLFARNNIVHTQFLNGEYDNWIETWEKKVSDVWNEKAIESVVNTYHEKGHIAAIEEMFKMNEEYGVDGAFMADAIKLIRYLFINDYKNALNIMEKNSNVKDLSTSYYGTNLYNYKQMKNIPRYIELLKKMKLPVD